MAGIPRAVPQRPPLGTRHGERHLAALRLSGGQGGSRRIRRRRMRLPELLGGRGSSRAVTEKLTLWPRTPSFPRSAAFRLHSFCSRAIWSAKTGYCAASCRACSSHSYGITSSGRHPRSARINARSGRSPTRLTSISRPPISAGRRAVIWPLARPLSSPGMAYWMVACSVYLHIAILGANVRICRRPGEPLGSRSFWRFRGSGLCAVSQSASAETFRQSKGPEAHPHLAAGRACGSSLTARCLLVRRAGNSLVV